jgi:hypothetical protein
MNSKAFIAFLIVTGLVSLGIILFFAKRHPNPRFRPKRGEILLLSIFMLFGSVGISFFLSQLFEHDWDLNKTKFDPESLVTPGAEAEGNGGQGPAKKEASDDADDESLPPFLRNEDK